MLHSAKILLLVTSGDLKLDLSEKMAEILSNVLIESYRSFFPLPPIQLSFELGVVILTPPPPPPPGRRWLRPPPGRGLTLARAGGGV